MDEVVRDDGRDIEIEGTYDEWLEETREAARRTGRYRSVVAIERQLLEFLCWPGPRRQPFEEGTRTISLWFDGQRWKLSLGDKRAQIVAFVTGEELAEVFSTASKGLSQEKLYWKKSRRRTR